MVIGPGGQLIARIAREAGMDLTHAFMCEVRLKISATMKNWSGPSSDERIFLKFDFLHQLQRGVQTLTKKTLGGFSLSREQHVNCLIFSHSSVYNSHTWDRACFLNSSCCCSVLGLLAPSLFIISKVFIQNLILAVGYIMNKSALFQNG